MPTSENMPFDMTERRLGAVVRRLRRQQDLTQEQLARRAGLTQGHLSKIEAGMRQSPTAHTIKRLARALGVPVTELLE
jgi:transcriptional regulator with XRE-family HTH domain